MSPDKADDREETDETWSERVKAEAELQQWLERFREALLEEGDEA